jgi:hypothetical protein
MRWIVMSILRRVIALASDLLFVFLAINALAIVLGFAVNLPVANGHGYWTIHESIIGMAFALNTFVWLLPLTALAFLP